METRIRRVVSLILILFLAVEPVFSNQQMQEKIALSSGIFSDKDALATIKDQVSRKRKIVHFEDGGEGYKQRRLIGGDVEKRSFVAKKKDLSYFYEQTISFFEREKIKIAYLAFFEKLDGEQQALLEEKYPKEYKNMRRFRDEFEYKKLQFGIFQFINTDNSVDILDILNILSDLKIEERIVVSGLVHQGFISNYEELSKFIKVLKFFKYSEKYFDFWGCIKEMENKELFNRFFEILIVDENYNLEFMLKIVAVVSFMIQEDVSFDELYELFKLGKNKYYLGDILASGIGNTYIEDDYELTELFSILSKMEELALLKLAAFCRYSVYPKMVETLQGEASVVELELEFIHGINIETLYLIYQLKFFQPTEIQTRFATIYQNLDSNEQKALRILEFKNTQDEKINFKQLLVGQLSVVDAQYLIKVFDEYFLKVSAEKLGEKLEKPTDYIDRIEEKKLFITSKGFVYDFENDILKVIKADKIFDLATFKKRFSNLCDLDIKMLDNRFMLLTILEANKPDLSGLSNGLIEWWKFCLMTLIVYPEAGSSNDQIIRFMFLTINQQDLMILKSFEPCLNLFQKVSDVLFHGSPIEMFVEDFENLLNEIMRQKEGNEFIKRRKPFALQTLKPKVDSLVSCLFKRRTYLPIQSQFFPVGPLKQNHFFILKQEDLGSLFRGEEEFFLIPDIWVLINELLMFRMKNLDFLFTTPAIARNQKFTQEMRIFFFFQEKFNLKFPFSFLLTILDFQKQDMVTFTSRILWAA